MSRLPDSFDVYQGRISVLSRPTRDEEVAWISKMRGAERAMIHSLFEIGHVARHLAEIARRVRLGEERADRWLRTRKSAAADESRSCLESRLDEVQRLSVKCERLDVSSDAEESNAKIIRGSLRTALIALNFKRRVIESTLDDMLRLEHVTHAGMSDGDIRELEEKVWMSLADFRQKVTDAERHHGEALEMKWRLVSTHLWLVPIIARGTSCSFLSFMDLVQEGNLGLIRAAEACGEGFDCRFSSYAGWWIRQTITRAIEDQDRLIRVPSYLSGVALRLHRARHTLEQAAGREVDDEEVAWEAGIPASRVRRVLDSFRAPVSIHAAVSREGDGDELGEFIADAQSAAADELTIRGDTAHIVQEVLSTLNAQEREVISLRFGLRDGALRTMEQIGSAAGLTKQRIQQIESRAMAKLRHPARLRRFAKWL